MKAKKGFYWMLAAALAAAGCSMPRVHYYTLDIPHASPQAGPGIGHRISIPRFRADKILSDDRVLYRENAHEVAFYEYHRWANSPADLVTSYFTHRLQDNKTYAGVSADKDGPRPDLILQGRLHRFEEVDQGKEVSASVALELELLEAKSRSSVWRGEAACSRPVATKDMAGVVGGIYGCLDEIATKLLTEMQKEIPKIKSQ